MSDSIVQRRLAVTLDDGDPLGPREVLFVSYWVNEADTPEGQRCTRLQVLQGLARALLDPAAIENLQHAEDPTAGCVRDPLTGKTLRRGVDYDAERKRDGTWLIKPYRVGVVSSLPLTKIEGQ